MDLAQPFFKLLLLLAKVKLRLILSVILECILNNYFSIPGLKFCQTWQYGRPKPFLLAFIQVLNVLLPNQMYRISNRINVALLRTVHLQPINQIARWFLDCAIHLRWRLSVIICCWWLFVISKLVRTILRKVKQNFTVPKVHFHLV